MDSWNMMMSSSRCFQRRVSFLALVMLSVPIILSMQGASPILRLHRRMDAQQVCNVSDFNRSDREEICRYITDHCGGTVFKISELYYCTKSDGVKPLLLAGITAVLVTVFMAFGLITSNFLYPNLDVLSKYLNISRRISGLTLLALGNATPDIFSTYNAMSTNSSSLAIGELIGSANFVICFIIGAMGIVKPFKVNHSEFMKDLYFFMVMIILSIYFIHDAKLRNFECLTMIFLYLFYLNYSIFLTNEGKDPGELEGDEESLLNPVITRSPVLSATQLDEVRSIKQSVDDNKLRGLQPLSLFDSVHLLKKKLPQLTRHSSSQTLDDSHLRKTITLDVTGEQDPLLRKKRSLSSNDISVSMENGGQTSVNEPHLSPQATRPSHLILEPSTADEPESTWVYLLPADREDSRLTFILTSPLFLILNIMIPVYSHDLMLKNEARDDSETLPIVSFKKKLLYVQLLIFPVTFKFIVPQCPNYVIFLFSLVLLTSNYRFNMLYRYTIPIIGFLSSISFVLLLSMLVVLILKNIGVMMQISESLLGLTVLALGNSIGDLISNLTLAELDLSVIGINACFGAPLIYILIGIGFNGITINLRNHESYMKLDINDNFRVSSVGLVTMLIFYAIAIPMNGWYIDRKIGFVGCFWWCCITVMNIFLEARG